jgi:2-haloacid dehalogenase
MSLYLTLAPFPEARDVLAALKRAGMRTAILSNGAPAMLRAAIDTARLTPLLDAAISVEEAGVFKPHPKTYQLCVDRMAVPPQAICFVSANGWDAYAASAFGLRVVWCNRARQPRERLPGAPDRVIGSLAELPELLTEA